VMVVHVSSHGAMLNSKALARYEITAATPTPPGGVIGREPGTNEPDGLLFETAFLPIFSQLPGPGDDESLDLLRTGQDLYLAAGITTAQEGATMKHQLDLLRVAADRGLLTLDVIALPFITEIDVVADGSPQGRTAFFTTPYLTGGPAGQTTWRGAPTFPQAELNDMVKKVYDGGARLFVHCNGDAAIDALLEAHRFAAGDDPARPRGTVGIHSQFIRPDQLEKYAAWKITPSFFTLHCFYFGDTHVANRGALQADFISPMKTARSARHQPHQPHRLQRLPTRPDLHDPHGGQPHHAVRRHARAGRADRPAGGPGGDHDRRRTDVRRGGDQGLDRTGQARRPRGALRQSAHGAAGDDQGHPRRGDHQGGPDGLAADARRRPAIKLSASPGVDQRARPPGSPGWKPGDTGYENHDGATATPSLERRCLTVVPA